ncbi:predicted protein [Streptomyces sp. SPB78]|nr:predicted protein [Streptomyces sp. SPB78]
MPGRARDGPLRSPGRHRGFATARDVAWEPSRRTPGAGLRTAEARSGPSLTPEVSYR